MKKHVKSFTLLTLSIFFLTFTACDNEPIDSGLNDGTTVTSPEDCLNAASEAATAAESFANATDANYEVLCNAYKVSLRAQIAACGDPNGVVQATIDALTCTTDTPAEASIIGTWRIVSLESNGVEELQDELDNSGICYWEETYTATTITNIDYSGVNCDTEDVYGVLNYTLSGDILSIAGEDPLEVLEISNTTLQYQDVYTDNGQDFIDVYTLERQ
ncbi:lipocalin family protein [Bizionia sp. KMM 8389]